MEELSRRLTIGQYLPTGSTIHRMDPRFKLLTFVVLVIAASLSSSIVGGLVAVASAVCVLFLARIPIAFGLNGLRPALPVMVIMLVLQVLLYQPRKGQMVWWRWGWLALSPAGIHLIIVALLKFISIYLFISILTLSTSVAEVTRGVEQLLRPLALIRVPAHEIALVVTITLRFVPTFAEEAERLAKAQASRGAPIGTVRRWQVLRVIRSVLPLVVPLLVGALRKGEQMALAMEARGYVPGIKRTSYTTMKATGRDFAYLLVCLGFCIAIGVVRFPF